MACLPSVIYTAGSSKCGQDSIPMIGQLQWMCRQRKKKLEEMRAGHCYDSALLEPIEAGLYSGA